MNISSVFRGLRRSPRLGIAVVLCIALGMAATAAVATLIDLTAFRAPPFPHAERLARVWNSERGSDQRDMLAFRDFVDLKERVVAFDALEGAARARLVWHLPDTSGRRVEGEAVSAGYFELLDVEPYLGRAIAPEEHARGDAVLLLSYDSWGREFGFDENILGRALRVSFQNRSDFATYTVIGVLPPTFAGTTEDDMPDLEFWIPLRNYLFGEAYENRAVRTMLALGRLAPAATLTQAQVQADALGAALAGEFDAFSNDHVFRVEAFGANWRSPFRQASTAFGIAAVLLLAVAVVNVALLLLARTLERRHEFAVRGALGASRALLLRQVLTETLLLAFIGGIVGVLAAAPLLDVFLGIADVNVPLYLDPRPELAVLATSFVLLIVAGCAAAALPAWVGARVDAADALREGSSKLSGSRRAGLWGSVLVVTELALTLVLITAAALLGRSWLELGNTDLGFAADSRLRMGLFVNSRDVANEDELPAFYERVEAELRAQPGVKNVALVWPTVPMIDPIVGRLQHPVIESEEPDGVRVSNYIVGDNFFESLEVPLLAGRGFDARESDLEMRSAVISASLVESFGGAERALNQVVQLNGSEYRVVGIAASAKFGGPLEGDWHRHEMYLSLRQLPRRIVSPIVQVDGDPANFAEPLKRSLARIAPESAVDWVEPVNTFIAWLYRDAAFRLAVIAAFGVSALLLALVGLYAVLSQQVVHATTEIGIRKSLGATNARVQREVVQRGLRVALTGTAVGLVASFGFARVLQGMLHGVQSYDVIAFLLAAGVLLVTALLASWLPARRAARIEPMQAIRHE